MRAILFMMLAIVIGNISFAGEEPPNFIKKEHKERWTTLYGGKPIPIEWTSYKKKDYNGDNHADWFIYNSTGCGSGGCQGDIYIYLLKVAEKDSMKYCYAGSGHQTELTRPLPNLKCESSWKLIE